MASAETKLRKALQEILDEPVPILASDDIANVHIPGTYAERIKGIAEKALEE